MAASGRIVMSKMLQSPASHLAMQVAAILACFPGKGESPAPGHVF
ncbi:MAG TPA: hypothetical protein VG894_02930 [Bauldia sp.]|nr:hypothetical protein [Bauldia sp.]